MRGGSPREKGNGTLPGKNGRAVRGTTNMNERMHSNEL